MKRLKNYQIDKILWDEIVTGSDRPSVYLLSWYLDIVTPGWEAYIFNNYKYLLPLPIKYKWGIPYLVQPPFCQKLGITGKGITDITARAFYKKLFRQFPYLNILLYDTTGLGNTKQLKSRVNYTLNLTEEFKLLRKNFTENTSRNIKKAIAAKQNPEDCSLSDFINFSVKWMHGVNINQLNLLQEITQEAYRRGIAHIIKITDTEGYIMCAACFLVWNNQIMYLAGASSPAGKKSSAMFLVMEYIISKFAATGFVLDFEGSNIQGVANFFRGFGGKASYYFHLKKHWLRACHK